VGMLCRSASCKGNFVSERMIAMSYILEVPRLVDSPEQLVAMIPLVVSRDQMPVVMGPGIGEIFSVVSVQGIPVTGPWFAHHYKITDTHFDFAICVPVASAVTASGRSGVRCA
jgi:hypothetical protein